MTLLLQCKIRPAVVRTAHGSNFKTCICQRSQQAGFIDLGRRPRCNGTVAYGRNSDGGLFYA
jgi:hypothetical protein